MTSNPISYKLMGGSITAKKKKKKVGPSFKTF